MVFHKHFSKVAVKRSLNIDLLNIKGTVTNSDDGGDDDDGCGGGENYSVYEDGDNCGGSEDDYKVNWKFRARIKQRKMGKQQAYRAKV